MDIGARAICLLSDDEDADATVVASQADAMNCQN